MPRRRIAEIPKWKQVVALACLAYAAVAWALPVFMLPFVNVLPYVHDRPLVERLPFSVAGSFLVVGALVALNGGRIPPEARISGTRRARLIHWFGVIGGLVMATLLAAWLSANTFGLVAKALPGRGFETVVVVRAADHSGARYKSVLLEYIDESGGVPQYLTLSKRLFDYPRFKPGDVIALQGEKTLVGTYINAFALVKPGLTGHSIGRPPAAAELRR